MEPHVTHRDVASFADDRVNLHRDSVKRRREQVNRLRERLEKHIADSPGSPLVKMLLSGSLAKGTALSTLNDIDVAVYLKDEDAPADGGELLDWLADLLRAAYPATAIGAHPGSHCVTVEFKRPALDVDIVPVLVPASYRDDPHERGFLVTKDSGERVLTSITRHLEFVRRRKKQHERHYAQVIRLVKWWARRQKEERPGFRCKSFLAELVCAKLADGGDDFSDYPQALETFFAYAVRTGLRERIAFTDYYGPGDLPHPTGLPIEAFDPVNPGNNIAGQYRESDRRLLVEAAHDALDSLTEARASDTKKRAVERWRDVLGPSFGR